MNKRKRPNISKKQRKTIIRTLTKQYGYKCWYCGLRFVADNNIQIDHIAPFSDNGLNIEENYALSCTFCNRYKWDDDVTEFLARLAFIRSSRFSCPILERFGKDLEPYQRDALTKSYYDE